MSKLDEFKNFVKDNPKLATYVKKGEMSWQKFYEMYDLYGDTNDIWKDYLNPSVVTSQTAAFGFNDVVNFFKSIDLDSVQNGISSLQRVLGVVQDFGSKDTTNVKEEYKPRPIYKHFED